MGRWLDCLLGVANMGANLCPDVKPTEGQTRGSSIFTYKVSVGKKIQL